MSPPIGSDCPAFVIECRPLPDGAVDLGREAACRPRTPVVPETTSVIPWKHLSRWIRLGAGVDGRPGHGLHQGYTTTSGSTISSTSSIVLA